MSSQEYIRLAQSLHPRLLHFFHKYPPQPINGLARAAAATNTSSTPPLPTPETQMASINADELQAQLETQTRPSPAIALGPCTTKNPFLPSRSALSSRIVPPAYSLRRQADLYKLARENGVAELLPFSQKDPDERARRRIEQGLRVKGTGVGQRVKGHVWERQLGAKMAKRKQAILGMPALVDAWKKAGYGRRWKQWPK